MVGSETGPSELTEYVTLAEWLDRDAGPFFATRSGVAWFINRHLRELVESGAYIPRGGRVGSLLHRAKFPKLVIEIHRRIAEQRIRTSGDESAP